MPKQETHYYRNAAIRPRRGGWQADIMRGNQRYRRQFPGSDEGFAAARNYIDTIHVEYLANERSLTVLETEQARQALKLLPDGVNLLHAAEFYVARKRVTPSIQVGEAAEKYLDSLVKRDLRARSVATARPRINRLAQGFPYTLVADVSMSDLETLLEDYGVAGTTFNNYRRNWAAFFEWCVRKEYATANPAKHIEPHVVDDDVAEFFPVREVERLFHAVEDLDPQLVPFFALGFFAGVRSAELHRMTGDLITPELVRVTPAQAKTRTWRHITPCDALRAWLEAYPPAESLVGVNHRRRVQRIRDSLKEERDGKTKHFHWFPNGGRKSFATYHLEYSQDAPATAAILGHGNPNLLYSNYRGLTTRGDAESYFAIRPKR